MTAERRAFVFSVRQTGNQIGAVCGSLAAARGCDINGTGLVLRWPSVSAPCSRSLLFERLRPAYAGKAAPPPELDLRARLALVTTDRRIAMLALASMPFSAMQVSLNTIFVTLGTRELGLSHIEAGMALACAQAGGLVGRLGWGYVAMRLNASRAVLVIIGLGMAFCAALLGLDGASLGRTGQFAVAALFGLTASGWNGVFVAEIARLAPQDRIGDTTGAVLTASYAGLLAAPALVSILDGAASLGAAFFALACLALCGTLALIWGGHDEAEKIARAQSRPTSPPGERARSRRPRPRSRRIEAAKALNAVVTIDPARTLADAAAVDDRLRAGETMPLAGVPVVVKDNIWVGGWRVTQGSRLFADFIAPQDAIAIERLRKAGAVVVGIGATSEFASKGVTTSQLYGPTRHPLDPALTPGGSSGGPAAAVAAGLVPLAIGTDAGGSSRRPPAHVGVAGFKPSYGAIPYGPGLRRAVLRPLRHRADRRRVSPISRWRSRSWPVIDPRDPDSAVIAQEADDVGRPAHRVLTAPRARRRRRRCRRGWPCFRRCDVIAASGLRIAQRDPVWPVGATEDAIMPLQHAGLAALYGDAFREDPGVFDPDIAKQIERGLLLVRCGGRRRAGRQARAIANAFANFLRRLRPAVGADSPVRGLAARPTRPDDDRRQAPRTARGARGVHALRQSRPHPGDLNSVRHRSERASFRPTDHRPPRTGSNTAPGGTADRDDLANGRVNSIP